jgi:hypothetical protein
MQPESTVLNVRLTVVSKCSLTCVTRLLGPLLLMSWSTKLSKLISSSDSASSLTPDDAPLLPALLTVVLLALVALVLLVVAAVVGAVSLREKSARALVRSTTSLL